MRLRILHRPLEQSKNVCPVIKTNIHAAKANGKSATEKMNPINALSNASCDVEVLRYVL